MACTTYYVVMDYHTGSTIWQGKNLAKCAKQLQAGTVYGSGLTPSDALMSAIAAAEAAQRTIKPRERVT